MLFKKIISPPVPTTYLPQYLTTAICEVRFFRSLSLRMLISSEGELLPEYSLAQMFFPLFQLLLPDTFHIPTLNDSNMFCHSPRSACTISVPSDRLNGSLLPAFPIPHA